MPAALSGSLPILTKPGTRQQQLSRPAQVRVQRASTTT